MSSGRNIQYTKMNRCKRRAGCMLMSVTCSTSYSIRCGGAAAAASSFHSAAAAPRTGTVPNDDRCVRSHEHDACLVTNMHARHDDAHYGKHVICRVLNFGHSAKTCFAERHTRQNMTLDKEAFATRQRLTLGKDW